jgi:hypothetical protein
MAPPRTPSGQQITCDGCAAPVEQVTDAMRIPVPAAVALANYGRADLEYIVCSPLPDGSQPCLTLAELAEELYDRVRCRRPTCTGC